jgi:TolA-binding protein
VEELKDRAHSEHEIGSAPKDSPGRKLSESLKEKSQLLKSNGEKGAINIDESSLDDMLDDLDEIGEAFSADMEDDPLLSRISRWEEMGYFVDKIKNSIAEDRDRAEMEADQFENDVTRMEKVKAIFNKMDLTGFQQEAQELMLKFQYPHLAQDVENELKRIEEMRKNADRLLEEPGNEIEEAPVEEVIERAPGEDVSPSDEVPSEVQSTEEKQVDISPNAESEDEETREEIPSGNENQEEEGKSSGEMDSEEEVSGEDGVSSEYSNHSPEEIMEMAKDSYKEGKMEEALTLFKELLKRDPNSSKARFMIRRISSKLGQ